MIRVQANVTALYKDLDIQEKHGHAGDPQDATKGKKKPKWGRD